MSQTNGLHGINYSDGTDKLIAIRYGVIKEYNSVTEVWDHVESPHFNFTADVYSTNFLDHAFFVNGEDANYSRNSSGTWSNTTNLSDSPIGKYIKSHTVKLFIGNIQINGTYYRSRVWMSDLPKNDQIQWGLETGSDLVTTVDSAVITSSGSTFKTNGIKVGDKIILESGSSAGEYTVRSVDSETQITLSETLSSSGTGIDFWVGGNWFDVKTDDGDELTGFGSNSNELLIFKNNSVHRYNVQANTLRQIKEAPGTSSGRSIVDEDEFTYYYDPSSNAIRRISGNTSLILSLPIEDIMEGISSDMKSSVVGWQTDRTLIEFFIGTVTTRDGYTISNCVVSWDTITESWSTRSLPFSIEQSTEWRQNSKNDTYIGTPTGKVLKVSDGYKYDTSDISFVLIDQPVFPEGRGVIKTFDSIRLYVANGQGDITVMYRILYMTKDEGSWVHSEWNSMTGKADNPLTEFKFKDDFPRRGMGIQLQFIQSSGSESFLIEDYDLFYSSTAIL